jgi:hypothetical protein
MNTYRSTALAASVGIVLLGGAATAAAQAAEPFKAQLRVPISGTAARNKGTFEGTLTVESFAVRDGQAVAIGMIAGTVFDKSGRSLGTAVVGRRTLPVQVSPGASTAAAPGVIGPQAVCASVLHLDIGAVNLNVLGLQIATAPVVFDLTADDSEVLGQLICEALSVVSTVVDLVGVLNSILGLLTGLLGGLTGGLGV